MVWQLRLEFITSTGHLPVLKEAPASVPPPKRLKIRLKSGGGIRSMKNNEGNNYDDDDFDDQKPAPAEADPLTVSMSNLSLLSLSPKVNDRMATIMEVATHTQGRDHVRVDSFSCTIPITVYPTDFDGGHLYPARNRFAL